MQQLRGSRHPGFDAVFGTNIIERLRLKDGMVFDDPSIFRDALNEIERLRKQSAWVIERDIFSRLHYWAGRRPDDWRADPAEALRFARRADAELMLTYHCEGIGRVSEHIWLSDDN